MKWIKKNTDPVKGKLRVVQADKGGALIIASKAYVRDLEQSKLSNSSRYINLGTRDPSTDAQTKLLNLWRIGEDSCLVNREVCKDVVGLTEKKLGKRSPIARQEPSTLPLYHPGMPYYYGLLKIHKLKPEQLVPGVKVPIRLVTNLREAVTTRSDKYINWKYLKPLQDSFCMDIVQDSTEVLSWLEDMNMKIDPASKVKGFSWDFAALYDNLSPTLVIKALRCAIAETRPSWSEELAEWLIQLVELSLESAFAKYGNCWYRALLGIPTGGSLSVTLANIAVFYALRKVLADNVTPELINFKRFIDDIAGLWNGSEESFEKWSDKINAGLQTEFSLSIKDNPLERWDLNCSDHYTVFLDIKFRFDQICGITTDINIKSTDARAYLHYSSFHPRQTFPSIVYSQALRYRRIINNDETLKIRLDELQECFINSSYPKHMVRGILNDVLKRKRSLTYTKKADKAPFPVVWVQTFGPGTPIISELVKKANLALKQSPCWKDVERPLGVVSRRGKNLGDLILQRKVFSTEFEESSGHGEGTKRCTSLLDPPKRGRKCKSCPLMSGSNTITSNVDKRVHATPDGNCKTKGVIYVATCRKCGKQYVGQTILELCTRICCHRSWMEKKKEEKDEPGGFGRKDEGALAEHLKQCQGLSSRDDFNEGYWFTIVMKNPSNYDKAEQSWINTLVTMFPYGLNLDKPRGVSETMLSMSLRQK